MIKFESSEQIKGIYDDKEYDFDRYNFIVRPAFTEKETSIVVNFKKSTITGDQIAFGSWYDIELDECIECLKTLQPNEIKRDFTHIIEKEINKEKE
ncbi:MULTISPECIES: hypothetical protein [Bacillus cereus group]|uniref:hypothetical protein n=1 Tax=Bacillus cereus group sp. BfR-BA-01441 TaxID=2920348 RepID=UPI000279FE7E|nr:hypothetical protein II9_05682 [Bacillus cereus MSX-D12]